MRVLHGDPTTWEAGGGHVVTIGVFDGVHLGHQHVIGLTRAAADRSGLAAGLITFDRHPLTVLAPEHAPQLLTSLERRLELFEEAGLDTIGVLPFVDAVRTLSPENFTVRIIVMGFGARCVVVGEDFRFGQDRAGNVEVLARIGTEMGFEVEPVTLLSSDGPISSSRIRTLVAAGEVEAAAAALGRPFELRGRVVAGQGRGGRTGPSTIGLMVPGNLVTPGSGAYAVWAAVGDGEDVAGVASIGTAPAPKGAGQEIEVRFLDRVAAADAASVGLRFIGRVGAGPPSADPPHPAADAEGVAAEARRLLGRRAP
ncbi:MAG: bifunctional riboflavin kinase/FAD synthetase [Actinobacteria bacterium]|nr:bifunctional riboflavin kinase/FAD synthetase [Actinomycetota bacterium]